MSTNGQFNGGNNQNGSVNNNHLNNHIDSSAINNPQIQSPNFNQSTNHKTQYHKKALDEIRISLQPFMNNERPTSSDDASSTSETSSNNFRNNYVDHLYHHPANYHSNSNAINKYKLTSPTISLLIPENDGLDYKNGIYTPSNASCSDKQSSPTPTSLNSTLNSNSDFMQLKHHLNNNLNSNNGKLLITQNTNSQFATTATNGTSNVSQFCSKITTNLQQLTQQQFPNELHSQMPINNNVAKLQAWSVRQTKSKSPVIMQSVKSTQVQKPILQTACAPIINQQQQQQMMINTSSTQQNRNQQQQQQYQLNENNLKTDLVQLNPNIAKQFLNKMISLENSNSVYQKQQMPLPDPPEPPIKSPQSPAYSLISDKSNNSNLNNCLEQYAIRTSSALSNCSNSSKMTSYSTTSSIATNASSIHNSNFNHHHNHLPNQPPPPYVPYSAKSSNVLNKQQQFNLVNNNNNQIVHIAKPITINNNANNNEQQLISNQVNQIDSRPPPPYQPPITETTFLGSVNRHFNIDNKLATNATAGGVVPEPPSYATSVLLKQQQLNSKQNKINRPLPPLPDEIQQPGNQLKSNKPPIQPGPPLPPKPTKLAAQQQHQQLIQSPDLNNQLLFNDELDAHNSASFNASSNLQLLQKQLEEHLQLNKPLVEKLKQIQLQKHQQKVLHNLKQQTNQQPPSLPAKNINTNNNQQATNAKPTISSIKRPQPAPPLLPKKDKLLNKPKPTTVNTPLDTVVPLDQQNSNQQRSAQNKKPNEYENEKNEIDNELVSDDQQSNSSSCQEPEQESRITHHSPIPQRKLFSKEYEQERRETKVKNYSAAAYKFFMEQHIENVIKSRQQRENRKKQLENEMKKVNLTSDDQFQMRKMLQQKESNYIRLRRARMDKSMFEHIKTLGNIHKNFKSS